jgi:hypothetical protein
LSRANIIPITDAINICSASKAIPVSKTHDGRKTATFEEVVADGGRPCRWLKGALPSTKLHGLPKSIEITSN